MWVYLLLFVVAAMSAPADSFVGLLDEEKSLLSAHPIEVDEAALAAEAISVPHSNVVLPGNDVLEEFECSSWPCPDWQLVAGVATATLRTSAKFSGAKGLIDIFFGWWMLDTFDGFVPGSKVSIFTRALSNPFPKGITQLAFDISSTGTKSFVFSALFNRLRFVEHNNFVLNQVASTPFTDTPGKWYRVEVENVDDQSFVGRIFDTDGVTLLESLSHTFDEPITSAKIGFGDTWNYVDLIQVSVPEAIINIELDMQPDSSDDVQFTHNVVSGGAFTLDDDTDITYRNLKPLPIFTEGRYQHRVTLQELPPNHVLDSIQCDSDDATVELDQRRVLIDSDAKEITCTFVLVGLGSCCSKHAADGCVKNIFGEECLDIDGNASWTLGGDCGQDECPRGACCLQFGFCDDRSSPDVCAAKGGSFNGLATKCDSKTCGACCGGNTVDGCADDIARSQCSSTATHVGGQRCAQSCGACCEDSTCTPRAQTSLNGKPCASFILGDYKCSKQCGSCCGESNCFDNKFESQCGTNSAFSTGSCDNTCGACCDDGSCKLTLGSGECSTGLFQGVGSNCGGDTCPLGNVCCQNDEDQPCLTDIDAVEDCTGAGQFAAENCNECLVRFAQLNLIVSSESNEISLSGADARKRNVESSSSSSSTSSSSYSSSSSSKSSRCSSSSSSSSSSSNNDCPLSIDMNVIVNNASPLTFNNVVIDVFVTMPRTAVVSSVNAEIGTFQWTKHTLHDSQVTGHGQWTIATLVGGDHPQLLFDIELKQPHVGENVQMHATLVSSEPSATSSAQEFIVTLTE